MATWLLVIGVFGEIEATTIANILTSAANNLRPDVYSDHLQVLTFMEVVTRRELSKKDETISGLVPDNTKMKKK